MLRRCAAKRMLVTFVRHSESDNNVLNAQTRDKRQFQLIRHSDPALTERGERQAQLVAQRIAAENSDASLIITSYFHRALRTAATLEDVMRAASPQGSAPRVVADSSFHEVGGQYVSADPGHPDLDLIVTGVPGRTTAQLLADFPSFIPIDGEECEEGWWKSAPKETVSQARARALRLWARLAELALPAPPKPPTPGSLIAVTPQSAPPTIVSIVKGAAAEKKVAAIGSEHKSIIVVTHGHLYSLMMNEAKAAGLFISEDDTASPFPRLTNTAITRVELSLRHNLKADPVVATAAAVGQASTGHPAAHHPFSLKVLLNNCDAHAKQVGTLQSAALPLQ